MHGGDREYHGGWGDQERGGCTPFLKILPLSHSVGSLIAARHLETKSATVFAKVRKILETVPDFETALQKINAARFGSLSVVA